MREWLRRARRRWSKRRLCRVLERANLRAVVQYERERADAAELEAAYWHGRFQRERERLRGRVS